MPLAEFTVFWRSDRDTAEPPTVERQRRDRERSPHPDLVHSLDCGALLVGDDERLLSCEEDFRRLVVEVHPREPLVVELGVAMGRVDPDLSTCRFLEPHGCTGRPERSGRPFDDPVDDLVHALRGGELPAELQQGSRALRLTARGLVETCVLERHCGVAGEDFHEADVVLVELV